MHCIWTLHIGMKSAEDLNIIVPYFIPVENKSGLSVSTAVFQLIDEMAACKYKPFMEPNSWESWMIRVLKLSTNPNKLFLYVPPHVVPGCHFLWQDGPAWWGLGELSAATATVLLQQCTLCNKANQTQWGNHGGGGLGWVIAGHCCTLQSITLFWGQPHVANRGWIGR